MCIYIYIYICWSLQICVLVIRPAILPNTNNII